MAAAEFDKCTTDELVGTIDGLHRLLCGVQRQLLATVAAYDSREGWREDGATSMAAWLAYRLGVAHRTGAEWARVAEKLEGLPVLAGAFGRGELSFDQVSPLSRVTTADTEEAIATEARGWSAAQCAAFARRVTPPKGDPHRRRSLRWRWDDEERMLHLRGRLPEDVGATVVAALEKMAKEAKPDPETGKQEPFEARAADALVELASSHLGTLAQPDRVTVVVHADASLLEGGEGVAEIEDGPVVGRETVRHLACDARAEIVIKCMDGQPLGVGRTRRTIPAWMARQLRHRDRGCRFPACGRRRWTHGHHIRHWANGGPTDLDNLVELCPFHHRLVHEGGWSIRGNPDNEIEFLRPNGTPLRQ